MDTTSKSDLHENRLIRFFDPETLEEIDEDFLDAGRYQWTGRGLDVGLDLQYNRARCYDPTPGVWIAEEGPVAASRTDEISACRFREVKTDG